MAVPTAALSRPVQHVGTRAEKHHPEVADSPACWPWRGARFNNGEASCWPHGVIFGCWTSWCCCRAVPGSRSARGPGLLPGHLRSHPHALPPSPGIWNNSIPLAWGNTAGGKKQGHSDSWEQAILLMPAT
ncbi:uncharacterized protein LOC144158898 [Haemaphysalis longicornis]